MVYGCTAVGFPQWTKDEDQQRSAQVSGSTRTGEGLRSGLLTLFTDSMPGAPPFPVGTFSETSPTPWSGMSGAAVIADDLVIGVVRSRNFAARDNSFTVTPVTAIDRLPDDRRQQFWDALRVTNSKQLAVLPTARADTSEFEEAADLSVPNQDEVSDFLVLDDRWELRGRMPGGSGSKGILWRATDRLALDHSERVVVRTVPAGTSASSADWLQLSGIRKELLTQGIASDNIGQIIASGEERGFAYNVYPLYRPGSLKLYCQQAGTQRTLRWCIDVILQVLAGLSKASDAGLVHLNIKPSSIVLDGDRARIVDWGSSRRWNPPDEDDYVTHGTPFFAALEQLIEPSPGWATPLADLYGVGATFYWLLAGAAPLQDEARDQQDLITYRRLLIDGIRPRPVNELDTGVPQALCALIDRWLSINPSDRVAPGTTLSRSLQAAHDELGALRQSLPERTLSSLTNRSSGTRPVSAEMQVTALSGLSTLSAASLVASWPTDRAADELLALGEIEAATIITSCDDAVGGRLLSAIAADQPTRARNILEMVTVDRAGQLLDHMSSVDAASALSVSNVAGAARIVRRADTPTVARALSEMPPRSAAAIVLAMDEARAVEVLGVAAATTVATILAHVFPESRRLALIDRLPPSQHVGLYGDLSTRLADSGLQEGVYGFGSCLLWVLATRATAVVDEAFAVGPARPSRHYGMVDGHPVPTPSLVAWLLTAAEAGLPADGLAQRDRRLDKRQKVLRTIVSRAISGEPQLFKDSWLRDLAAVCGLGRAELDLLYRCRGEEGRPVDVDALRTAIGRTLRARPGRRWALARRGGRA